MPEAESWDLVLSIICFMVSWSWWWGWCRGQGKGAAKTAKIIVVMVIIVLVVTAIIIVKTAKIILVMVMAGCHFWPCHCHVFWTTWGFYGHCLRAKREDGFDVVVGQSHWSAPRLVWHSYIKVNPKKLWNGKQNGYWLWWWRCGIDLTMVSVCLTWPLSPPLLGEELTCERTKSTNTLRSFFGGLLSTTKNGDNQINMSTSKLITLVNQSWSQPNEIY